MIRPELSASGDAHALFFQTEDDVDLGNLRPRRSFQLTQSDQTRHVARLGAAVTLPPWPRSARRRLPAAAGRHRRLGQGAAGNHGRRHSCQSARSPYWLQGSGRDAAVGRLHPVRSGPRRGRPHRDRAAARQQSVGPGIRAQPRERPLQADTQRAGHPCQRDPGGRAIDRDRAATHRRDRRQRAGDRPSGCQPHPGPITRHRRSRADQATAGSDRQDDLPSTGRRFRFPRRRSARHQVPALQRRLAPGEDPGPQQSGT